MMGEGRDGLIDRVRAGDIRLPVTVDEADAALAMVDGRIASIEERMTSRDVEPGEFARATTARKLWQTKRRELAYARARLVAGEPVVPPQDPALAALVARVERVEAELARRGEVSRA